MIRHCVFIRFRPEIGAAERAAILGGITDLQGQVAGLTAVQAGANVSPEAGMDKGYADGFIADFIDAAARDAYLAHPAHEAAGARIVAAAEGGVNGVLVYDLEMAG